MQVLDKPKMMYAPDEMDDLLNGQHFINLNKYSFLYREASGAPCMMGFIDNEATTYTAKDYENLPEDAPYQLIDGNLIFMFSPTRIHQKVLGNLYRILTAHCEKEQLGEVYFAPLDVRFSEYNILQPDLIFVSNARKHILQERINGAPDFVVEILSKNRKYEKIGKSFFDRQKACQLLDSPWPFCMH